MKQVFLIFFIILSGNFGFAQTPQLNEAKYYSYRSRLYNDFMIGVGSSAGLSLPASIRDTVNQKILWGDATIDLGMYMGMLATEYKVNELKGLSQTTTIEDLFFALEAFNRLDYNAEKYFGGTPSLNGFFVRDDVTTDSLNITTVLAHLNQPTATGQVNILLSDLMAIDPTLKEESLDQVIHLLAGLSLVVRYIPDTLKHKPNGQAQAFMDFETSIKQEAKNIATRLVNYIKEGSNVIVTLNPADPNLNGISGSAWDFIIKNPVTGIAVARGPNATALAAGFTAAKYWITNLSSLTTDTLASTQALNTFLFYDNVLLANDQDFKVMMLNAIGNVWPAGVKPDSSNFNYNAQRLGPRALFQSYEYIPLWHQSLYNTTNKLMSAVPTSHPFYNNPAAFYKFLLDEALIAGPYNYGNLAFPSYEWSSSSRHVHPLRRGQANPSFPGHYNGLDYMLLYNLYFINTTLGTTVAEIPGSPHPVLVYPNPARGQFTIQHSNVDCSEYVLTLTDATGEVKMQSKVAASNTTFSTTGLKPGMYMVQIISCGYPFNSKLVIY